MATIGLSGGAKLEETLRRIAEKTGAHGEVRVGFLENANPYPDGTTVATVAVIHEFGAPSAGIDPRPFFRPMIAKESPHWGADIGKELVAANYDAKIALGQMGSDIKGALQDSILALTGPALAPATIARKGFSTLLIDTGVMYQSIDFEVNT